ncbi:corrinoid protein [Schwartzia succinivorans]|jgi:corrinoid protein of di/trimethylamine methyltransferase|uniref:Methyltransferase cognate corrinoid proteins n=1 Tax=Schwartzia succinivorans DSM 10502 TaxID=1123243 RepID=A0A1M4SGB2_9FIRM|nr:corrinoid protein [Schwartzia succinivorans]MBQ1470678.1 corrinoid protein [Schwartzia sp. (in: firmicutes)]MBE6096726.1 cobalamin-binding protein [Schwartzia succinivorans]MBQ1917920.1 corrinoid protein [Schwartzia sp. (in: firmicutes)]MBQ3862491.1 corrinoid protein [Schwartzia sp. (in: firmicutes)]MBQ4152581.1 corrinoid protein [Schwartzia sp. (in: firmicutes)]
MATEQELHQGLYDAVVDMDEEQSAELASEVVKAGYDAYAAIEQGLSKGMDKVGELYEQEEYFIPELLLCSDAMYAGIDILKPHIVREETRVQHKVVIGVVEGDTHDIGKNLVKIMLESAGFEVIDLGRDIKAQAFIDAAEENGAEIIALSTLMTTAMPSMQEVVELLEKQDKRDKYKVLIGGGPISPNFAKKIRADAYASTAAEAARIAKDFAAAEEAALQSA